MQTMTTIQKQHRIVKGAQGISILPPTPAQAMGNFLSRYDWDWWGTITFREDVGTYTAENRIKQFLRWLERQKPRRRVAAFYALERHRWRGDNSTLTPHLHFLVTGVADLRRDLAWRYSFDRNGRTQIEPYDPGKGAAYYISKYVGKEAFGTGEWDVWRPGVLKLDKQLLMV